MTMRCHEVDFEIIGDDLQMVEVELVEELMGLASLGAPLGHHARLCATMRELGCILGRSVA